MIEIGTPKFVAADQTLVAACVSAGGFSRAEQSRTEPKGKSIVSEASPIAVDDGQLRNVRKITITHVTPGMADTPEPTFEVVDPCDLLVDDSYQRGLSERSLNLIRRIIGQWDWRRFKPPVCARTERGLEIIDGQHTAIAAMSHPMVQRIPIMVVTAAERGDRAQAFIGHNRDRLGITQMQMHYAAAAAGDEDALTINQVCERAGVRVLRSTPGNGIWKPGDTVAVRAIGALINRRGAMRARIVLEALAKSGAAPLSTGMIKAVEVLLHEPEYQDDIDAERITDALMAMGQAEALREATVFSAAHKVPVWKALAVVIFRKGKRRARRT